MNNIRENFNKVTKKYFFGFNDQEKLSKIIYKHKNYDIEATGSEKKVIVYDDMC